MTFCAKKTKVWQKFSENFAKEGLPLKASLNCGLVMARIQEARWEGSPYSLGMEVSELTNEGEQGQTSRI